MSRDLRELKLSEWRLSDVDLSLLSDEDKYHICMDGIVDLSEVEATDDTKVDAIVVLGAYPNHIDARLRKGLQLGQKGYSNLYIFSGGKGVHRLLYRPKSELVKEGLIDQNVANVYSELEKLDTNGNQYINKNYYIESKILNFIDSVDTRIKNKTLFDGTEKEDKVNKKFKEKLEKTAESLELLTKVYEQDGEDKDRIEALKYKKKHLEDIIKYLSDPEKAKEANRINHSEASLMRKLLTTISEDEKPKGMKSFEEPFSLNTAENAAYVGKLIKDIERTEKKKIRKICVISSAFSLKRTILTFKKKLPGIEIVGCPSTQDLADRGISLNKDALMTNDYNRKQILLEPEKCQKYTRDVYDELLVNMVDEELAKKIVENQLKNVPIDNDIE